MIHSWDRSTWPLPWVTHGIDLLVRRLHLGSLMGSTSVSMFEVKWSHNNALPSHSCGIDLHSALWLWIPFLSPHTLAFWWVWSITFPWQHTVYNFLAGPISLRTISFPDSLGIRPLFPGILQLYQILLIIAISFVLSYRIMRLGEGGRFIYSVLFTICCS